MVPGRRSEAAERLSRLLGQTNTAFYQGYLEALPALVKRHEIGRVDMVVCTQVIHHTSDWRTHLRNFATICKDGGILVLAWVNPGLNWGSFLVKNRIAYRLGRNKEERLRIGRFLFGWWDKRYNRPNIEWESFFADRYSAFYAYIPVRVMLRELKRLGFELIEAHPPLDARQWLGSAPQGSRRGNLARLVNAVPALMPLTSVAMKVRQFVGRGGGSRAIYCRKVRRPAD